MLQEHVQATAYLDAVNIVMNTIQVVALAWIAAAYRNGTTHGRNKRE